MSNTPHDVPSNGEWRDYKRQVLSDLHNLTKNTEKNTQMLSDIKADIAVLKFKSSLYGAGGAAIVIILVNLAKLAGFH